MAHKKAGGTTKNGRDSNSKRLGVKLFGGEVVRAGGVIIRQKGNNYLPGLNVGSGRDRTLYAMKDGVVQFAEKRVQKFNLRKYRMPVVNVV